MPDGDTMTEDVKTGSVRQCQAELTPCDQGERKEKSIRVSTFLIITNQLQPQPITAASIHQTIRHSGPTARRHKFHSRSPYALPPNNISHPIPTPTSLDEGPTSVR
ncbi:NT-3 growth factor receptor [Striga asiatica]|uniref:NT-3 growth factor receptor n=1 Tax=Striga asiatica TaxID=4170 RepID=A0A5A7NXG0_STRAF|nr:NT-3 growth factor receptor [Striga asiatica]